MRIEYVDSGLANRFSTHIELHKDLKNYPELHDIILKHELGHDDKVFSFKDFIYEFGFIGWKLTKQKWLFMLKRPKTWVQLLPLYVSKSNGWIYDVNLIIIWIFIILIGGLNIFLWNKIL